MTNNLVKILKWKIKKDGHIKINIKGSCMEPFIMDSETLLVKNSNNEFKSGDIVLIYTNESLKAHRITLIKKNKVYTKGDNAFTLDRNHDYLNIIGIIKKSECTTMKDKIFRHIFAKLSFLEGYLFRLHNKGFFPFVKWMVLIKLIKKVKSYIINF